MLRTSNCLSPSQSPSHCQAAASTFTTHPPPPDRPPLPPHSRPPSVRRSWRRCWSRGECRARCACGPACTSTPAWSSAPAACGSAWPPTRQGAARSGVSEHGAVGWRISVGGARGREEGYTNACAKCTTAYSGEDEFRRRRRRRHCLRVRMRGWGERGRKREERKESERRERAKGESGGWEGGRVSGRGREIDGASARALCSPTTAQIALVPVADLLAPSIFP